MGVRADDEVSGNDDTPLGEDRVLYTLTLFEEVLYTVFLGKIPHDLCLLGRLYILGGNEVGENEGYSIGIEYLVYAVLLKYLDG